MNMRALAPICALILVLAVRPTSATSQTGIADPRAEVAAALYAASATQAVAKKLADAMIEEQKARVAELQKKFLVGALQHREELASAQERFVAALETRDHAYAQEISVFRGAVKDIASTPEGAAALARFNNGDELGALAILDKLQAANDAARKARADVESAAEKRRIAALALEANNRGKVSITSVIERYQEVTALDPGVTDDWVQLDRLYQSAGRLGDALNAAQNAARTATTERDRAVAWNEVGDVATAQGDLAAARKDYEKELAIFRRLAAADPGSAILQRDVSVGLGNISDMSMAQGDLAAARKASEESLAIDRHLSAADPGNAAAQRDLSVELEKIGDVAKASGDLESARKAYEECLAIDRHLSNVDPGNADAQRDVTVDLDRIGDVAMSELDLAGARRDYEESLGIRRLVSAADPGNADAQRNVSVSLGRRGNVAKAQGDLAGARKAYEESVAIYRRLTAADPSNADAQLDVAWGLKKMGDILVAQDDVTGAEKSYREMLAIMRHIALAESGSAAAQEDLEEGLAAFGDAQFKQGDLTAAHASFLESVDIARHLVASHPDSAVEQRDVGIALLGLAKIPDSGVTWQQVVAQFEDMKRRSMLAPKDVHFLDEARQLGAKEARP